MKNRLLSIQQELGISKKLGMPLSKEGKSYFVNSGSEVSNNIVYPLINGEDAWKMVHTSLLSAKHSISMCFWGFDSTLQLIRKLNEAQLGPEDRKENTIFNILDRKKNEGVKIRILLWDFSFKGRRHFSDYAMILAGSSGVFEILFQPHPTHKIGSWHQKTIIVDDKLAYVGGMNAKENDWDTSQHLVFDARRAKHDMSSEDRKELIKGKDYENINPPRRDYMTMIKGPAATAVIKNFVERWNFCIDQEYDFSKNATKMSMPKPIPPTDFTRAQITRTIPKYGPTPKGETSIYDSYKNAIHMAKKYIYIEDQYFRSQALAQELAKVMRKNKKLILIVVTQPDYLTDIEPEEKWKVALPSTYWTNKAFETVKKVVPNFSLFYFQNDAIINKKRVFKTVNIHSKLMIVDDEFYTIGSANVNERSFEYDGELNVAVHSPISAKRLRKEIFTNVLQTRCPDDITEAAKLWYEHAKLNRAAFTDSKKPESMVYSFNQNGPLMPMVPNDWN